jgi:7,8-dihydro-6-hydroxymethylpterin-pyrophosphokinase
MRYMTMQASTAHPMRPFGCDDDSMYLNHAIITKTDKVDELASRGIHGDCHSDN